MVRRVGGHGATYLGPLGSRRTAELVLAALHDAVPLRQCTQSLPPRQAAPACVLADPAAQIGRCHAPCEGGVDPLDYRRHVEVVRSAVAGDPRPVTDRLLAAIGRVAGAQRFDDAARQRDRLAALTAARARHQRLLALARCALLLAAQPAGDGGWEVVVVRHGRLVESGRVPRGAAPRPYLDALVAAAEEVSCGPGPTPCASAAEMECILRWLTMPGTRLVERVAQWCSPAYGAGGLAASAATTWTTTLAR